MKKLFTIIILLFTFGSNSAYSVNTDSLEIIVKNLQGREKVKMLSDLCYYLSYSDVEKSEKYGNECLQLALLEGDSTLIANAYNDLSILFTLKADYKKGLEYNLKAYQILKNLDNPEKLISSISKIGVCYSELGDFENSTTYLLEAISIVEQNHLEEKYYLVYDNLGGNFKEMEKYEAALKYHQIAYDYAIKTNNARAKYTILINIAGAYAKLGDVDKSIELHLQAIKFLDNSHDLRTKALLYSNLASLYSSQKNFSKALEYSNLSIPIYHEIDNTDGLSLAHNNIAMFYLENNLLNKDNAAQVEEHLKLAKKYAEECKSLVRQSQNLESYSSFFMVLHEYEKAMIYKLKYDSVSNLIFTQENNELVENLKAQYETEKKEKELIKNQLKLKQKNYQLIMVVLVMVLVLVIAIGNYRKFKFKRKKLQEEAALKDELAHIKLKNEIQDERLRISRDLHDNIGSQLTFIISSLEMANYSAKRNDMDLVSTKIKEIKDFSAATIEEFRDTIWALNKESISLDDLEVKILSFISKAKAMVSSIQFETHFTAQQELKMDSEKGIKVFRIIQESVNNAIKHSSAKKVDVMIDDKEEFVRIRIMDDGKGMDLDHLDRKSGLRNMEERAKRVGGAFEITSQKDQGTEICLKIASV